MEKSAHIFQALSGFKPSSIDFVCTGSQIVYPRKQKNVFLQSEKKEIEADLKILLAKINKAKVLAKFGHTFMKCLSYQNFLYKFQTRFSFIMKSFWNNFIMYSKWRTFSWKRADFIMKQQISRNWKFILKPLAMPFCNFGKCKHL